MTALIGRTLANYRILEQIGQGGMSRVFRAVDVTTDRAVALKILAPVIAHDPTFQARFEREVKLLRRLEHPHIVPVLDYGRAHGLTYIVMPFLGTGTLHERLGKGPLDPVLGGRIVDQLASALSFAHENGVVHRDVKPSNVLLDESGNAFLSDFSFARPRDASENLTGSSLVGTPAYMSPEQCRGEPIDHRSDQYSFAVMLFQIATGQLPFEGETPMALAMKHVSTPLPLPRTVNPNLPETVELVLIKALAKDPAMRFPSVRDLNAAFQKALQAALDPAAEVADAPTLSRERTMTLYRRYQNVTPPSRRRRYDRSAILAGLLLLLACTVAASAIAVIYPEVLFPVNAAAPDSRTSSPTVNIQATVDVVLTANADALGPGIPASVLQTMVYGVVLQTLEATLTPQETFAAAPSPTAGLESTLAATLIFPTTAPTATPSRTWTPTRTATRTPTRTSTPSVSPTSGATPTATSPLASATSSPPGPTSTVGGPTDTEPAPTNTSPPTSTSGPTNTSVPPTGTPTRTNTAAAPTNTSVPPTNTSVPPTNTALACDWHQGSASISDDMISVRVYNDGGLSLHVSEVSITWSGSDNLRHIRWRFEDDFWDEDDPGPTVTAGTNKTVPVGTYRTVEFEFAGSTFDGDLEDVGFEADC